MGTFEPRVFEYAPQDVVLTSRSFFEVITLFKMTRLFVYVFVALTLSQLVTSKALPSDPESSGESLIGEREVLGKRCLYRWKYSQCTFSTSCCNGMRCKPDPWDPWKSCQ